MHIGNSNTASGGYSSLGFQISSAQNGYARIQSTKSAGSAWGILALNEYGGSVGVGTATPGRRFQVQDGSNMKTSLGVNDAGEPALILSRWGGTGSSYQTALVSTEWNGSGYGLAFSTTGVYHNDNVLTSATTKMYISQDGNVGIGTKLATNPNSYKLAVNGTIGAKAVKVETSSSTWADYVFLPTYRLRPLSEVESYIKANQHLPEVPSAEEVEKNGHNLGEMDATLLKKIEELTLYMIEMKKDNEAQKKENQLLKQRIEQLEKK